MAMNVREGFLDEQSPSFRVEFGGTYVHNICMLVIQLAEVSALDHYTKIPLR